MKYRKNRNRSSMGLTLLEMVIAVAIVTIVFAAVLPLFRTIQNSWDSKQGSSETIQNGRVLSDHLNRNLSAAVKISAVSNSSVTDGYIEFEDNDANTLRYDIAASNYVEFGPVGDLSDLAGPVSELRFTCYDACDLDTPLSPVTDTNLIRLVKVDAVVSNSASQGSDKTFSSYAYLRVNGAGGQERISKGTAFEFDILNGEIPALIQIDSTHYLCAYGGPGNNGWAVVLTADTASGTISAGTAFEYDADNGEQPALAKIDDSHYLCAYAGDKADGFAVVLTVDTGTWNITKGTPFEYDIDEGQTPALAKIDDGHYLCAYAGDKADGFAVVLTVDTGTWNITKGTPFEYDIDEGQTPALAKIDDSHYLCAYAGDKADGFAVVLAVDTGNWTVSRGTPFEFDTSNGGSGALSQIDSSHYLCSYTGPGSDGWAVVLTVNTSSWTISKETGYEFDTVTGTTAALVQIDSNRYLCAYSDTNNDGQAVVLTVNSGDWTITAGSAFEYDTSQGIYPALAQIDSDNYLCAYTSLGSDGWSVILTLGDGLRP